MHVRLSEERAFHVDEGVPMCPFFGKRRTLNLPLYLKLLSLNPPIAQPVDCQTLQIWLWLWVCQRASSSYQVPFDGEANMLLVPWKKETSGSLQLCTNSGFSTRTAYISINFWPVVYFQWFFFSSSVRKEHPKITEHQSCYHMLKYSNCMQQLWTRFKPCWLTSAY